MGRWQGTRHEPDRLAPLHRHRDAKPRQLDRRPSGGGEAPAYRGLAYVVFERLPLAKFGNRVPQLSFEVVRAANDLEDLITAVAIIPGATEFGYDPQPATRYTGFGATATENTHAAAAATDWTQSIDQLQALCPNSRTRLFDRRLVWQRLALRRMHDRTPRR